MNYDNMPRKSSCVDYPALLSFDVTPCRETPVSVPVNSPTVMFPGASLHVIVLALVCACIVLDGLLQAARGLVVKLSKSIRHFCSQHSIDSGKTVMYIERFYTS